uniref:Uncharacterized protein n=1 Tax=Rhizophora mucronata TaxID=61149 RepID=A0A2P2Q4F3_RHIMU
MQLAYIFKPELKTQKDPNFYAKSPKIPNLTRGSAKASGKFNFGSTMHDKAKRKDGSFT